MKTNILSVISALAITILIQGCHDPKEVISNGDPRGLLSIKANFINDESSENEFDALIDYDNHTITVRFPMYYPRVSYNELLPEDITNVRLTASLSTNCTIEPALTTLDLTKTNYITVKNPQGVSARYSIKGEILKLWDSELHDIELADGTPGIVDTKNNIITLLAPDDLEPQTATVSMSPHATISPDIINEPFDFNSEDIVVTVTAQNGVDKTEYTVIKGEPERIPFGHREGSETLRWAKRWTEVGYTSQNNQTGFGVTEKYLVLNEVGVMNAVVLKASNGTDTGKRLDMNIIPNGMNNNMTSDHAGNIIVNSKYSSANPSFKLWVFKDIDDKGKLLIDQSVYGAGDRVSVYGDITKDAVIVAPLNGTSLQVCRWFVKDGVPGKAEVVALGGVDSTPYANVDIAPTSATNPNADMYGVFYATVGGRRGPVCFNGSNKAVREVGNPNTKKRNDPDGGLADAGNWIMNACDYREFNKNRYMFHNSVNTFPWGDNDRLYLIDVSGGDIKNELFRISDSDGAISLTGNMYGAMAAGFTGAAGNANDARLWVSSTGFYMYGYFLFTNGYIGCIRVDCIQY